MFSKFGPDPVYSRLSDPDPGCSQWLFPDFDPDSKLALRFDTKAMFQTATPYSKQLEDVPLL